MKAKDARMKAEFVRYVLRNKSIEEFIEEIYDEMRMAWRNKNTKITKLIYPGHKSEIESFLKKKGFNIIDVTPAYADEETPRELLISWKKGGIY